MIFLNHVVCSLIVFWSYYRQGYYTLWSWLSAVRSFFREKRKLSADVLTVSAYGIPVGTLMASIDNGWLPVDDAFPVEMAALRKHHPGKFAYFGKFAVAHQGSIRKTGFRLVKKAATEWSLDREVEVAIMMVNPRHVPFYRRFGASEVARSEQVHGLEKAPAVLMIVRYNESPHIRGWQREYLQSSTKINIRETYST